jgi:DNA polymerase III alpha subunit
MKYNNYGQITVTSNELCNLLYKNPELNLNSFFVEDPDLFNNSVANLHYNVSKLKTLNPINGSITEFDFEQQSTWHMPDEYKQLDIAKWLIECCHTNEELARIEQELLLYQERNLFSLLQYLKYLVDTMRSNSVVWGVGRGSSVASYALYLIGVHKINSIKYHLDIVEFLK